MIVSQSVDRDHHVDVELVGRHSFEHRGEQARGPTYDLAQKHRGYELGHGNGAFQSGVGVRIVRWSSEIWPQQLHLYRSDDAVADVRGSLGLWTDSPIIVRHCDARGEAEPAETFHIGAKINYVEWSRNEITLIAADDLGS